MLNVPILKILMLNVLQVFGISWLSSWSCAPFLGISLAGISLAGISLAGIFLAEIFLAEIFLAGALLFLRGLPVLLLFIQFS